MFHLSTQVFYYLPLIYNFTVDRIIYHYTSVIRAQGDTEIMSSSAFMIQICLTIIPRSPTGIHFEHSLSCIYSNFQIVHKSFKVMVMETPSPQCVGREFVRQYYTLLHEAPLHLHRLVVQFVVNTAPKLSFLHSKIIKRRMYERRCGINSTKISHSHFPLVL